MRKKDDNEDYEPSPLRGTLASFERYLKGKNYGYSIVKDVKLEKARRTNKTSSAQHAENSAKAVNRWCHFSTGVRWILCSLCAYLLNNSALSSEIRYYTYSLPKPKIKSCISKLLREKTQISRSNWHIFCTFFCRCYCNINFSSYTFNGENFVSPQEKICCLCSCSPFFHCPSFLPYFPLAFLI